MTACAEGITDMCFSLGLAVDRSGFKLLHDRLQIHNICSWICSSVVLSVVKKFPRQTQNSTIHLLHRGGVKDFHEAVQIPSRTGGRELAQWVRLGCDLRAALSWRCREHQKSCRHLCCYICDWYGFWSASESIITSKEIRVTS